QRLEVHRKKRRCANRVPLPRRGRTHGVLRHRQRRWFRHGPFEEALRRVPTAARRIRVRRDWRWFGNGATHRPPPRRRGVGRSRSRSRGKVFLYPRRSKSLKAEATTLVRMTLRDASDLAMARKHLRELGAREGMARAAV